MRRLVRYCAICHLVCCLASLSPRSEAAIASSGPTLPEPSTTQTEPGQPSAAVPHTLQSFTMAVQCAVCSSSGAPVTRRMLSRLSDLLRHCSIALPCAPATEAHAIADPTAMDTQINRAVRFSGWHCMVSSCTATLGRKPTIRSDAERCLVHSCLNTKRSAGSEPYVKGICSFRVLVRTVSRTLSKRKRMSRPGSSICFIRASA